MNNRNTIFVYGTLRAGGSNHFRLGRATRVGIGTVRGRLYRIDWYPGVVLDERAGAVLGDVFEVDTVTLASLDEFEGGEYRRIRTVVSQADGSPPIEAWIWEYQMPIGGFQEITDGDWLKVVPAN